MSVIVFNCGDQISRHFIVRDVALAVWVALALVSCRIGSQFSSTPATGPFASPTPMSIVGAETAYHSPTLTPQVDERLDPRTTYVLSATLDYERHHLVVSQTITFVNRSAGPLPDLLFVVEPNRQPGTFRLNSLNWTDGRPIEEYELAGARLSVPLTAPVLSGETVGLFMSFELDLPSRPGPFGYTSRQTNLGDWYPFVPPYRVGQGWLVNEPSVIGEHLSYDVADYEVEINLIAPSTEPIIAASAPFDTRTSRYKIDAARSFAWSASTEYRSLSETVGSATVMAYAFPEHLAAGEAALRATAAALALHSNIFDPYPHTQLTLVEADFADGMEYDGLYFLGQEYYAAYAGSPQDYLTAIAVHETAHQWWYGLVGNDQANEPWLDETLSTYSELLFYETAYPDLTNWWWEFRVARFEPVGWINSTIYDHGGVRPYVDAVYLRGALFIDELRKLLGDHSFFAFLQDYVRRGRLGQMTTADFFDLLAKHTTADLEPLIFKYFKP